MSGKSDYETEELNVIVNRIDEGFHDIIKKTLTPYVKKMQNTNEQIKSIHHILKQLPEFQELIATNAELRMEVANLKRELKSLTNNAEPLTLKVIDTNLGVNNTEEHVETIYDEFGPNDVAKEDLENDSNIYEDEDVEEQSEEEEQVDEQSEEEVDEQSQEQVDEQSQEQVDEQSEEEADSEEDVADEEEVYIIEIEGSEDKEYYTNDDDNGDIYKIEQDGNIGAIVGKFLNGEPEFIDES